MTETTSSGSGGVFVSWTRADTDRAGLLGQLLYGLQAAGVPLWLDDGGIGPFDPIPDLVRAGLAESIVLLLWHW
jgi:hypothetical protein